MIKKISLLYTTYFFFVFFIPHAEVFGAQTTKYKTISANETKLISLFPGSRVSQLYKDKDLGFFIESDLNIELKEKNNTLFISTPLGVYTGNAKLTVIYKAKKQTIDFQIDIKSKQTDFNIYSKFFRNKLQEHALSCESAASASILSYLSEKIIQESTVVSLLQKSEYYNRASETKNKTRYWGDPQSGFVGLIDHSGATLAQQKLYTGYGVYENPISKIYTEYGFTTERINQEIHSSLFTPEEHLSYLLNQLEKGNMVQLWGDWCTRTDFDDGQISATLVSQEQIDLGISGKNECSNVLSDRSLQWYSINSAGEQVSHTGLDGEHAFVLLGWKGEKINPTHVRVWDTYTGYHQYQTEEWMRKWELMNYKSIVVHAK